MTLLKSLTSRPAASGWGTAAFYLLTTVPGIAFACFMGYVSVQLVLGTPPKPNRHLPAAPAS